MLTEIPAILDSDKLENIRDMLAKTAFIDGKASAGMAASRVKNNEELQQGTKQSDYLDHLVMGSLAENAIFRSAALPLRVAQPVFARYTSGMFYGDHVDDPVMGAGMAKFRSDVSVTVFLNEPDEYDGGELIINTSFGEKKIKLAAGSAVLYPSNSVHRVAEITRGKRLAAIIWIQSMIRDPAKRELLYELDQARNTLLISQPDNAETKQVDRTYANLVRRWCEV